MTNTNHYETDSFAYTYYSQIRICLPVIRKNVYFRKKKKKKKKPAPGALLAGLRSWASKFTLRAAGGRRMSVLR